MDSLSRVSEPLPDIEAVERAQDVRRRGRGGPKGTPQRRPKKDGPGPTTASGDGRESGTEEEGARLLQTGLGEEVPVDQECPDACYSRDRTIAPIPPKGRLIDIAI